MAVPLPLSSPVTEVDRVIAGVVVDVATEPAKPLAETTETEVTVPVLAHVPSPRQNVELDAPVPLLRLVTGRLPVTCVARLTPESVPPSVRLPEAVTVPVRVMPLTEPVPPTDVTVPTARFPDPNSEDELTVLILVPETSVACLPPRAVLRSVCADKVPVIEPQVAV